MSKIDYYKIALDKAKEMGYDAILNAGERDGWHYFGLVSYMLIGHKLGKPDFLKISDNGNDIRVEERDDIIWALHQEISLNNL